METAEEREARERLNAYEQAAEASPGADKAALAIAALAETEMAARSAAKKRRWAYAIALSLPPVGIAIASYYYFSRKPDGKRVGWIMLVVSAVGFALLILSFSASKKMAPQSGIDPELQGLMKEYQ